MRILPRDLLTHLRRGLSSTYLVWGEEPLQRMEALDTLRAEAKNQGYTEREVIEFVTSKDEERAWAILNTPSLFTQKRLIEFRLQEGNITKPIQNALLNIVQTLPPDTILILLYPGKFDATTLKSSWYTALERNTTAVMAAAIPREKLPAWLAMRAKSLGLTLTTAAINFISHRTEGNLVAASQCLEKLALIYSSEAKLAINPIDTPLVAPFLGWENRHSIFDLADTLLQGAYTRTNRILESLRNEGIEPTLVCWAITREVRSLIPLAETLQIKGHINEATLDAFRVWKQRRTLIVTFLKTHSLSFLYDILAQAKNADIVIKTEGTKRAWQALQDLCYCLCRGEVKCRTL